MFSRFSIYFVNLDPTIVSEIKKTRPCVIISPNEMNFNISTVIIAPITSKLSNYPTRIPCKVEGKQGQIVLDQIRTVDKISIKWVKGIIFRISMPNFVKKNVNDRIQSKITL